MELIARAVQRDEDEGHDDRALRDRFILARRSQQQHAQHGKLRHMRDAMHQAIGRFAAHAR